MKLLDKLFFVTLLALFASTNALAFDCEVDGIYYNLSSSDNTASVTNNSNAYYSGSIVIPEQIFYEGVTYSVTSIGDNAFNNCMNLTNVSISNSVTSIEKGAFSKTSLRTLIIGTGVQLFNRQAFLDANQPIKTVWLTNNPPQNYSVAQGVINYVANSQYGTLNNRIEYKYLSSMFDVDGVTYVPISPSERTCDVIDCIYDELKTEANIGSFVSYQGIAMKVINIQPYLFYQNNNLQKATLNIVGSIGMHAFDGCTNLQTIELGETIIGIEEYAFNGCSNLKQVIVPDSVKEIGAYAFQGCISMVSATIGNVTEIIKQHVFDGCSDLVSLNIGDSVKIIEQYAFNGCSSLPCVTIPGSVLCIGDLAFSGCKSLKEVFMKERKEEIKTTFLSDIESSTNGIVLSIPVYAGYEVSFNYEFHGALNFGEEGVYSRYGTTSNGTYKKIFKKAKIFTVTLGGAMPPNYCHLTNIKVTGSNILELGSNEAPLFADCPLHSISVNRKMSESSSPFKNNKSLFTVIITDNEERITAKEFYGCTNLKNVEISDSVTTIGEQAFFGCSNLQTFILGKSVESIGKEVFSDCTVLTQLVSHASTPPVCGAQALDDINKWTCKLFVPEGCMGVYQSADQWKEFFYIEEGVPPVALTGLLLNKTTSTFFVGESDTLAVSYIPENTSDKEIEWSSSDDSIAIVDNNGVVTGKKVGVANIIVRSVSNPEIFASCEVTVQSPIIIFADAVVKAICVERWDTNGDGELNEKEAAAVTDLGTAFRSKSIHSFDELKYFTGLSQISKKAFYDCSNLESIIIPDGVKNIGDEAFVGCNGLIVVTIPNTVTTIGARAFVGCSKLASVNLPQNITVIEEYTFKDCSELTSIIIPNGVTDIGNGAFAGCI